MQSSIIGSYDCVKAFSEDDFTEDLKKINVPTLFIHGDADQIVPYEDASVLSAKLVRNSKLKIYPGAPHGLCTTHADQINGDLLAFLKAQTASGAAV
jgi:non-heme chloroperoxidase